ncbi:MAG: hypothetical protein NTV23_14605 [Propionibacteriales bacterium]|nr:hypothetical protein [Propionibacteriales bacterium]
MRPTDPIPSPGTGGPGRRGFVLATGAAVAVTAGCSLNNPFNSAKTPAAEAADDLAPDVALAVTAVGALAQAQARIALVTKTFPALRPRVAGLTELHAAHLQALRAAVPKTVDPTPAEALPAVPASRTAALEQVAQTEQALHNRLVGLALRAESGPFARLLATMAAGLSQQLVASPLSGSPR